MSEGALSARISDAPTDPIFGIVELHRADPRPHKINLAAGVYMDCLLYTSDAADE